MSLDLHHLPSPMPPDAVLVGPDSWTGGDGACFSAPADALAWLQGLGDADPARLVILHQDAFAGPQGLQHLEEWLTGMAELPVRHLAVLLHGGLEGSHLVRLFRAGLFDAVALPLSSHEWLNVLIRAERRLERRQQSRQLLRDSARAQDLLRDLKDSVGQAVDLNTGELLKAQETLEAVNRRLTHEMQELSLLYRFGRELSQARNWDEVLGRILGELGEFLDAGGATLVLKSAVGGAFRARRTWGWEDGSWDRVLLDLEDEAAGRTGEQLLSWSLLGNGMGPAGAPGREGRRVIALPLDHQGLRLGYLLLLFPTAEMASRADERFLPFLQAVQVILAEEVAGAQMLDRIRDIGVFNARVLETVSSGIWVFDETGTTVYCNRAGQEMLAGAAVPSSDPSAFLYRIGRGRLADAVGPGEDFPELIGDGRLRLEGQDGLLLPTLRAAEGGLYRGEGELTSVSGEVVPVAVQASLMEGQVRHQTWLVIVAEDLRERRQLEQERMRVDKLQGLVEMSATLAHEIRNPLMGLSAQAELLADQLEADDPRRRYIDVMTREVERINSTIDRMLNFTRPYRPELAEGDLLQPARDALELCRSRAEARQVDLELEIADLRGEDIARGWSLCYDEGQIKQVLLNLLLNAIDAAPRKEGRVVLELASRPDLELPAPDGAGRFLAPGVVIRVVDNGPGFTAEVRDRIFRPFFTTKSSGTGLGLSLCHKIVTAHGGDITASREDDRTVFQVLLPRQARGGAPSRLEVAE